MIFLVGGRGLVGSAIARYLDRQKRTYRIIQRENQREFYGRPCNILIYANGNARGYLAESDPHFDFKASVASTAAYVNEIRYQRFILVSSAGVYVQGGQTTYAGTTEDAPIDGKTLNHYGFHKYLAEQYVRHFCPDYLIFRLSSLVGDGLAKNQVYDFIAPHKKVIVSPESSINFIHTDTAAQIMFRIIDAGVRNEIFNVAAADNIELKKLEELLGLSSAYAPGAEKKVLSYRTNTTKLEKWVQPPRTADEILKYYYSLKKIDPQRT